MRDKGKRRFWRAVASEHLLIKRPREALSAAARICSLGSVNVEWGGATQVEVVKIKTVKCGAGTHRAESGGHQVGWE